MRRSLVLASLASLATAAGLVIAPVPVSAGSVGRLVMTGNVAQFDWRTCPNDERGVRCRRTVIIATDQVVHETNDDLDPAQRGELLRWGGPAVILRIWDYELDPETGDYVMIREAFGGIGVPGIPGSATNPVVRIDTQLRSVRVRATGLRMDVFYPDREAPRTASVDLTASGTGPLRRIREGQMWWSVDGKWVVRARGWQRDATGSGAVDGSDVHGTLVAGGLQHGRYTETTAVKGPMKSLAELTAATLASTALRLGHFSDASGGASWDSCALAAIGELCRQTYVTYDVMSTDRGERRATASLYESLLRVSDVVDGEKTYEPVTDLVTSGVRADVTAERDVASARVDVTGATAQKCTYAGPDESRCLTVAISFSASFTGQGPTSRINNHSIAWGGWGRELIRVGGAARAATATGSIDGRPFQSASVEGSIGYVRGFVK